MPIIICALCVLVICLSWIKEKNIYNPLLLFFGMWGIIVFGASLRLFGLYKGDDIVYIIIFIGLISYLIGFSIAMLRKNIGNSVCKSNYKENNIVSGEYVINEKAFYIIGLFSMFIIWKTAIPTINLLLSGTSLYDVRYVLIDSIMQSQNNLLLSYLALPFVHIMIHLSLINFFIYRKNKFLLLTIPSIVGVVLTNGARLYLLYFFIDALIIKIVYKDKNIAKLDIKNNMKSRRRRNIYISLVSIFTLVGMIYITLGRKSDVLGSFYRYAVGCIPHMSLRYKQFESINQYTYGVTSYQGVVRPLFSFLEKIGMDSRLFYLSESITEQWQTIAYIAPDAIYNFCVTPFMYFYVDLGIVGVIIGSLLYGVICGVTYKLMKSNANIKSLTLYLMIVQSLLVSFMRYQFTDLSFCLSFVYINFIIQKKIKLD